MLDVADTVDKRIDQQPVSLHYRLMLPQAICNPSTKEVEDIFSAPGNRDREVITKGMSKLFETPGERLDFERLAGRNEDDEDDKDEEAKDNPQVEKTNDVITSPNRSRLLSSGQQGSTENRIGYYGPLTFLDSQTEFVKIFGNRPVMLPINPTSTGNNEVQMM